ncbi:MAG TPA: hypothetical protein VN646_22885 [Candidatus Acidoferrum sp.]|jgi:hypothetical protein|nr:hypothetical protein [Candidatus Acidoferrum sp.]
MLAVLAALAAPARARTDDPVWSLLKGGGQAVFIRHAITTPGR